MFVTALRKKLAEAFSACILARRCKPDCNHTAKSVSNTACQNRALRENTDIYIYILFVIFTYFLAYIFSALWAFVVMDALTEFICGILLWFCHTAKSVTNIGCQNSVLWENPDTAVFIFIYFSLFLLISYFIFSASWVFVMNVVTFLWPLVVILQSWKEVFGKNFRILYLNT